MSPKAGEGSCHDKLEGERRHVDEPRGHRVRSRHEIQEVLPLCWRKGRKDLVDGEGVGSEPARHGCRCCLLAHLGRLTSLCLGVLVSKGG